MADESGGGWTRFFRRKDLTGENFFSQFLDGVARIFEGGDEEDTYRQIRSELVRAFDCDDVSLFFHDTSERPGLLDGDWVLKVKSGFGEGNRVCQRDATELPELVPGKPVPFEEELAQKAALKAIALAYKQTLESSGKVDPAQVSQLVSEVLRGVGACVWKRCREHELQPGENYAAGFPGRVGHEGFGVVLPLLQPHELCMWAVRLSKEVIEYRFQGEELLVTGDVTVSLRVIPFAKGSFDDLWGLVERALGTIVDDQVRARRDPDDLALAVNTIQIFSKGRWTSTSEFVSNLHT